MTTSQFETTKNRFITAFNTAQNRGLMITDQQIEELLNPDFVHHFIINWTDDSGHQHTNNGWRIQFNNKLGPYKGGLRLHPTVNEDILKSLALEQVFKNSLTTLDLGGAKGGSDFDPRGRSDQDIKNFCEAFMRELYPHIGPDVDVPAGDIGTGAREIKYLGEEYRRLASEEYGHPVEICRALTGKAVEDGGSLARKEATGYGLVYFVEEYLCCACDTLQNKNVLISGSGNVAIYAAEKCQQLGACVLTMSDSDGFIYDENGINLDVVKQIKEVERGRISDYVHRVPDALYVENNRPWSLFEFVGKNDVDIALPCATQNEIEEHDAYNLCKCGVALVAEGSNLSSTDEAVYIMRNNNIVYFPGKASNAGGVAVSGLEMIQNAEEEKWSYEKVDKRLQEIMRSIFHDLDDTDKKFNLNGDYVAAANIAGLVRLLN